MLTGIKIGEAFTDGQRLWRCTDIGTRTIIGIPLDYFDKVTYNTENKEKTTIVVYPRIDKSLHNGPPYFCKEEVMDEDNLEILSVVTEEDVLDWKPKEI